MEIANAVGVSVVVVLAVSAVALSVILAIGALLTAAWTALRRGRARAEAAYWEQVAEWSRRPATDRHIPIQVDDACRAALNAFHRARGRPEDRMRAAITAWGKYARRHIKHGSFIPGEGDDASDSTDVSEHVRITALTPGKPAAKTPHPPRSSESDTLKPTDQP